MKNQNLICKIFGHNWLYSFSQSFSPLLNLRSCKRCACIQEYKYVGLHKAWVTLISLTKFGAKEYFSFNKIDLKQGTK